MDQLTIQKNSDKRKERRKQTAEDFTPAWLVKQILDKLAVYNVDCWKDPRKTFIDPACGNGNFLVEVVKRKLKSGHKPLDVAKTVFGLDIMNDNITEARFRLCRVFDLYNGLTEEVVLEVWKNVRRVEDTLKVDFDKVVFRKKVSEGAKIKTIIRKVQDMNKDAQRVEVRRRFVKDYFYNSEHVTALQNVHTPFALSGAVVKKLGEYTCLTDGKSFLTFNPEFVDSLIGEGVSADKITFVSECKDKVDFVTQAYGVHGICDDFVSGSVKDGFDVVVGNPPYQKLDGNNKVGQTIWPDFVKKSFEICKTNGYVNLIHPSTWRARSNDVKSSFAIFDNDLKYLEIHDKPDGQKTFGATTRYDWYVCSKNNYSGSTNIKCEDGEECSADISNLPIIPNKMIDKVVSFMAKDGEETVRIEHSYSSYFTLKPWISKEKTNEHVYPVVYSTPMKGPTFFWSSINDRGHYGVSKLIINPANPISTVVDSNGEYAMSQFCMGIVGDKKYLETVATVFANQKTNGFAEFMEASHLTNKVFDKRLFELFRKDFWKDFV